MHSFFRIIAVLAALVLQSTASFALDLGKLKGQVWGNGRQNVVVLLHGDGGPRKFYATYGKRLAQSRKDTTVIMLTRPAFTGPTGKSPGRNPDKNHYISSNNALLGESLRAISKSLNPERMIVVGHSGGAAMAAVATARFPGAADVVILAACPCDVPNWRRHRRAQRGKTGTGWKDSQSPHKFARKIPSGTKMIVITGTKDDNTLPKFARTYVGIAQKAGANITYLEPRGVTHSWRSLQSHVDRLIRSELK